MREKSFSPILISSGRGGDEKGSASGAAERGGALTLAELVFERGVPASCVGTV